MPRTRVSFEMRQKARSLRLHATNSAWHVAQFVKGEAERVAGNPSRPLRGHPPLKGEGDAGAVEEIA
jgi:hypothetical protein